MEENKSSTAKDAPPKKMKFAPKIPPRRVSKPAEPKSEVRQRDDDINKELLKRAKEGFGRTGPKIDRKLAPVQVAFGHGAAAGHGRFGTARGFSGTIQKSNFGCEGSVPELDKEYVEPWDYYSYYPVTLPLRRPYSGDPEYLDEQEFGEASADYAETQINSDAELGLTENEIDQLFLFQLPSLLPVPTHAASRGDAVRADGSKKATQKNDTSVKGSSVEDMPAGYMGKMLVYQSGAVKLKLGDILFDVTPGLKCSFAQDVAAINLGEKHCCILGELNKRAVVTADVDSLIDSIAKLD